MFTFLISKKVKKVNFSQNVYLFRRFFLGENSPGAKKNWGQNVYLLEKTLQGRLPKRRTIMKLQDNDLIREIQREDLTDGFFDLLSQLSGEVIERDSDSLWDLYNKMKPGIVTMVRLSEGEVDGTATILIENKLLHCGSRVGHIEDVVVRDGRRTKG